MSHYVSGNDYKVLLNKLTMALESLNQVVGERVYLAKPFYLAIGAISFMHWVQSANNMSVDKETCWLFCFEDLQKCIAKLHCFSAEFNEYTQIASALLEAADVLEMICEDLQNSIQ